MFRQDSTCPALLVVYSVPSMTFRIHGYHALWLTFPGYSPKSSNIIYRLIRVRSPLLAESRLISFPPGTQMVQFSRFASRFLCIQKRIPQKEVGFPIRTSRDPCFFASFSALFAGLHVLHRLSSPRHPPDALIHLTLSFQKPSTYPLSIRFDFNLLTDGFFHNKAYYLLCR